LSFQQQYNDIKVCRYIVKNSFAKGSEYLSKHLLKEKLLAKDAINKFLFDLNVQVTIIALKGSF
jgi:hypothetical protein